MTKPSPFTSANYLALHVTLTREADYKGYRRVKMLRAYSLVSVVGNTITYTIRMPHPQSKSTRKQRLAFFAIYNAKQGGDLLFTGRIRPAITVS